jgi:hypothetical protein
MVTVLAPLVKPTPVSAKISGLGWNCTEPGTPPVPLSGTTAEEATVGDAMVSVPVKLPSRAGAKSTPTEQLAPAASVVPQEFVTVAWLKGDVTVKVSDVAAAVPVFVTVTVWVALVFPGATMGKTNCEWFTSRPAKVWPEPASGTVTDATPEVEEETASEAVAPPAAAGVKVTATVQLFWPLTLLSVAPQVVVPVEKLAADCPVI